ncbi:MAG: ZapG family protein [Francisellaceae bacterium]
MIIALIIGIIAALIIGFLIGFSINKAGSNSLERELHEAQTKFDSYQSLVNEHISKTHKIMENIYHEFMDLQKQAHDYSIKLNVDPSRQSILQPKAYVDKKQDKNLAHHTDTPKDYAENGNN